MSDFYDMRVVSPRHAESIKTLAVTNCLTETLSGNAVEIREFLEEACLEA